MDEILHPEFWTPVNVFWTAIGVVTAAAVAIFNDLVKSTLRSILAFCVALPRRLFPNFGGEVRKVFQTRRHAEEHIARDIAGSRFVFALIGRGNYLQREIVNRLADNTKLLRVIIPATKRQRGAKDPDWTAINEAELAKIDEAYRVPGTLAAQLAATAATLQTYRDRGVLDFREVNFPHLGRLIITEKNVYLTPYDDVRPSADNKTIAYAARPDAVTYGHYLRLFNLLWQQGSSGS